VKLNIFPPSRSLYFTVFPPPETTPSVTERLAAATPSLVAARPSRTCFAYAAAARIYRLAIPGQKLLHVGSDGGLFATPREVDDLMIANSERVEVLVRGGAPGSRAVLQTLPYDRYDPHTRPADWNQPRDLLELRTSTDAPQPAMTIPTTLRVVQAVDTKQVAARRALVFSQGMINGKTMDMRRVDVSARLGTTEIWQIENSSGGWFHPVHIHLIDFKILSRNGRPPFAWELGPKDTVYVGEGKPYGSSRNSARTGAGT